MVADRFLDATIGLDESPNPWDTVAGVYQVRQAGGTVTDIHSRKWKPGYPGLIASNGRSHDTCLQQYNNRLRRSANKATTVLEANSTDVSVHHSGGTHELCGNTPIADSSATRNVPKTMAAAGGSKCVSPCA